MKICSFVATALMFGTAAALPAQDGGYKPARYYDGGGKRTEGFIDVSKGISDHFLFRRTLQDKPEKVKTWKLSAIVIGADSFAVVRNFKVESDASSGGMVTKGYGLGRVLETGKVNLYDVQYHSEGASTVMFTGTSSASSLSAGRVRSVLIVQQRGSEKFFAIEKGIDDFIEQMSVFFKMSPPVVEKLKNREYSYDKSQQLVHDFNAWYNSR